MDASSTFSPALGGPQTPSSSINSENSNDQQLPVWVETKTKDNKVYYYSSATKETTWKKPENVKIVKYEDLQKKGQQQQQQQKTTSNLNSNVGPNVANCSIDNNPANLVNPATFMQSNISSPNMGAMPQAFQPQFAGAGMPGPNMFNTRPPMGMPPMGIGPPAAMAAAMAATMRFPPMGMANGAMFPAGQNMMGMPPFMPPMWRPMNGANAATLVNRPMISETDIQRRIYLTQVNADLRDRAVEWQEYKTPDNQYYFLNIKTSERTTEKPPVIQELDDAIAVIKEQKAKKAIEEARAQEGSPVQRQGDVDKVGTNNDDKRMEDTAKKSPQTSQSDAQTKGGTSGKQKESMKPVSTTAVPGTPWCVVWTDKNRVFYFNPSTKTSVWERPAELRNREDVDKMVSNPIIPISQSTNDDDSRQSASSDQSSAQAEKKIKLDSNSSSSVANQSAPSKPAIAPKIMKKEVASEIEKEAAKKRETISFEERVDTFKKLLEEKEVNPASVFQKELSKIVFDPRYLLLTSVERRDVFEKWCTERKEVDHLKRRERIKKATSDFNKLLEEANLTSHSRYDDFHSQYSKDPRYIALDRTKDREILFDDHLALLRRKERDEKTHKRRPSEHRSVPRGVPREEAENIFYALLIEFIIDPDIDWHEGKRILRRSPQWDLTAELPREWKEAEYNRHLDKIYLRRRDKFHQLLGETKHITLASEWRDVKRIIIDDPRYIKFSSSERRCEREFREFIRKRRTTAEDNFRQLLRETKLIDGDTRRKIEESEHQHLIDIIGTLQNDKRYVELEPFGEERRKILLSYIEELAATSSESSAQATSSASDNNKSPQPPSASSESKEEEEEGQDSQNGEEKQELQPSSDTGEKMSSNLNNNDTCSKKTNENIIDNQPSDCLEQQEQTAASS